MKKIIILFIYACLMGLSTQSFANSMKGLVSLEDHQLANVVGQAQSLNNIDDIYDRNHMQKIAEFVASLTTPEAQGGDGLNMLSSLFFVNDRGQTVLQIDRPVVAIGVIEATLSITGLNDLGHSLSQEISFQ